ncbi:hypothetical protein IX335_000044 [Porphyromonas levii]|nr:hypothetical protein [Porphyromonas levii]
MESADLFFGLRYMYNIKNITKFVKQIILHKLLLITSMHNNLSFLIMRINFVLFALLISMLILPSCEKVDTPDGVERDEIKSLKTVWTTQMPFFSPMSSDFVDKTVQLKDGGLLIYSYPRITKVNSSGKEVWTSSDIRAARFLEIPNGNIITSAYVDDNTSVLNCLSPDGKILWSVNTLNNNISYLALGLDGKVYALSYNILRCPPRDSPDKNKGVMKVSVINSETGEISIVSEFSYTNDEESAIRFGEGELYVPNSKQVVLVTYLYNQTGYGSNYDHFDICLFAINLEDNKTIKKKYGGVKSEAFDGLAVSSDGSLYILGITDSNDGDVKSYYNYVMNANAKPWVVKLDSDFNIVWEKVLLLGDNLRGESISLGNNSVYITIVGSNQSFFYGMVQLDTLGNYKAVAFDYGPHELDNFPHSYVNGKGESFFYFTKTTDEYYKTKTFWMSKKVIEGNL